MMVKRTLNDLLNEVAIYNVEELERVKKAYQLADILHKDQMRQSKEPYIVHPLKVALILAEMGADGDTLCAGLLHDALEDSDITKAEISSIFNEDIASLVDGVTTISKLNFSSKEDQNYANTRKIITSLTKDVRILIIKLADRLHNMQTLNFKSEFKQKENALETIELYVPLAYYIGAYRIKSELEDLSLKYLKPNTYKKLKEIKLKLEKDNNDLLLEMMQKIKLILEDENISNHIKVRTKNIYGIFKGLKQGKKVSDIHDLLSLKIMVNNIRDCYLSLGLIHQQYYPVNEKFKDYICNPKTNMYKSLHSTVFGPEDRLVQTQIRTHEMDRIASFGLTAYWEIEKGKARDIMQKELKEKFQFFKSLTEINMMFGDNQEFIHQIKKELFADRIYAYTTKGEIIELPKGSTVIDFAYKIHTDIGNRMIGAFINGVYVSVDHILSNKDRVLVITDDMSYGPQKEWLKSVKTVHAKRRIKEFIR